MADDDGMARPAPSDKPISETRTPEADVSAHLRRHLLRLQAEERCIWRSEVRLLAYTHAHKGKPDTLRIDYVLSLDGGPLVGVEVKRRPDRAAELGRGCFQAAQYAMGMVASALATDIPQAWVGQPLAAVFLRVDQRGWSDWMRSHAEAAPRLYGPANVGFLHFTKHMGMRFSLGGETWWSEKRGYRADAMVRKNRVGNGSFRPGDL